MKWLWLEDQPDTTRDFMSEVKSYSIEYEHFRTPQTLLKFLIEAKKKNKLSEYGLILDVLLIGAKYITLPIEWSELSKEDFFKTDGNGYDGGLKFYEKVILNLDGGKPFWKPLPPVVFFTVVHNNGNNNKDRLNKIKTEWANINGCDFKDAKVTWREKWEAENKPFYKVLKELGV